MPNADILDLLAQAQDGAYAVDMSGRIIFWNHGAERILGHGAAEVLGRRCFEVLGGVSEEEMRVCASYCEGLLWAQRGSIAPAQTIGSTDRDGRLRWLSVVYVGLPAADRGMGSLVHIFHDVTEEVEAKRLLQKLSGLLTKAPPLPVPPDAPRPMLGNKADRLVPPPDTEPLSLRELEVLHLLAQGMATKAIAGTLVVSPATVRNHVQHILEKLGAHSRLEAVASASQRGLL